MIEAIASRTLLEYAGQRFVVDRDGGTSIAIPFDPHGPQPVHFGAPAAHAEPLAGGDFIGDTRAGGSCNCESVTLVPHCNGTHTEGPGHLTRERLSVHASALAPLYAAALVSVEAVDALGAGEASVPGPQAGDRLLTARALAKAMESLGINRVESMVVRSLPNDDSKLERNWMEPPLPPYFSCEAMRWLTEKGVRHLLTDLPSVDRLRDEGRLAGHRIFFGLPPGSTAAGEVGRPDATITEMVYAPASLPDGLYALSLQLAAWVGDAAPSRPVLFPLEPA
jgi:arylformamidase